ncbi:MAG: OmpA family protein, partial [Methyloligellaceae bacterium]
SAEYRFSPKEALGIPNYNTATDRGYITLGCGGKLTLQLIDNALVDVPGPDLYVFEIGNALEPTRLEISADGKKWTNVGRIAGGRADVDIAKWAKGGKSFRYVRLTDLRQDCDSKTPGADIDAVGAIGSGLRLTLTGKVLFDSGKSELKPEAFQALDDLGNHFTNTRSLVVEVAGHTDAVGSSEANQGLSERRAQAVAAYLAKHFHLNPGQVNAVGYGESQPVADNKSDEGLQSNRRVEITLMRRNLAESGAGLWRTSVGPLALAAGSDGKVIGRYPEDNGRWFGEKQGHAISGYWVENGSSRACKTKKDGSRHWGRIYVELNEADDRFDGWWSYCDSESHDGELKGEKVR